MGTHSTSWSLFIDESGSFDEEDPGRIVGLLIQDGTWAHDRSHLLTRLAQVAPTVPHPLHARDLNIPAFHLCSFLAAPAAKRAEHWAGESLTHMSDVVAGGSDELQSARDAAVKGLRNPRSYDRVTAFDGLLRREVSTEYRDLCDVVGETRRRMGDILRDMLSAYGPERCAIVGAAGRPDDEEKAPLDRYLNLLPALFERVFLLLRKRPAEDHMVRVWTATRDVEIGSKARRAPLSNAEVSKVISHAKEIAWLQPLTSRDPEVWIVPTATPRYDEKVPPGLVLADFLSNGLNTPLQHASGWRGLMDETAPKVVLPIQFAPRGLDGRPLPTLAAGGHPRSALNAAFAGGVGPDLRGLEPGWVREQAMEWIVATAPARAARA